MKHTAALNENLTLADSLPDTENETENETENGAFLTVSDGDGLTFKLEIFEGPLDLLLALIAKNKVNIYDIPISLILDQYLEYIRQMDLFNLEVASEFIVMASQLMVIKSRLLLPRVEEDEEDPRKELVDLLLEYQRAKKASEVLHELEFSYAGRFEKPPFVPEDDSESREYKLTHELSLLQDAYKRVIERAAERAEAMQSTENLNTLIRTTHHVSVNERIIHVMQRLTESGRCSFSALFVHAESRSEIVATFLAVLELVKDKRVHISEADDSFADCTLTLADA